MSLPKTIPLIVLPDCTLFPHALLPLYIFEPRYRAMLAEALDRERFFSVGTLLSDDGNDVVAGGLVSDDDIHPYSCAGIVRACVGGSNGTSRLILQGISRIRFAGWVQREPFRVARIESVPTVTRNVRTANRLVRQVINIAREFGHSDPGFVEQFDKQFRHLTDPEIVADVIGYNFLPRTADKLPLLGMPEVDTRLGYLLERLHMLEASD
jgi:Lon protease-like protein